MQWPQEGIFEGKCCNEVEAMIKHYKAKYTSDNREGKRAKEREVLGWFRQEGIKCQQMQKEVKRQKFSKDSKAQGNNDRKIERERKRLGLGEEAKTDSDPSSGICSSWDEDYEDE